MNEQRCPAPAPGWRLVGEAVGAGGTLPAPPPPVPWLPATQGGTPTVCCLCPSQAAGTAACTRVPPSTCGLRASCLCNRPGPGCTPASLCLRPLCPPRAPEALPGSELEGRFPVDSSLVPAVPCPTSGRDPEALSPGSAGRWAGCQQVGILSQGAASLGLGGTVRASQGPDGQMCVSPLGQALLGRVPGLSTPQGQSLGEPSPRGTLRPSCWIQHEKVQDAL